MTPRSRRHLGWAGTALSNGDTSAHGVLRWSSAEVRLRVGRPGVEAALTAPGGGVRSCWLQLTALNSSRSSGGTRYTSDSCAMVRASD